MRTSLQFKATIRQWHPRSHILAYMLLDRVRCQVFSTILLCGGRVNRWDDGTEQVLVPPQRPCQLVQVYIYFVFDRPFFFSTRVLLLVGDRETLPIIINLVQCLLGVRYHLISLNGRVSRESQLHDRLPLVETIGHDLPANLGSLLKLFASETVLGASVRCYLATSHTSL